MVVSFPNFSLCTNAVWFCPCHPLLSVSYLYILWNQKQPESRLAIYMCAFHRTRRAHGPEYIPGSIHWVDFYGFTLSEINSNRAAFAGTVFPKITSIESKETIEIYLKILMLD